MGSTVTTSGRIGAAIPVLCSVLIILGSLTAQPCRAATADETVQAALEAARTASPERAIPLLEEAETKHPFHSANSEILYQLGSAYIEVGQLDKAEQTFAKLIERYGKYADTLARVDEAKVQQARVMAERKEYDQAIAQIRALLDERPNTLAKDTAMLQLAAIYGDQGDIERARKILEPYAANERHPLSGEATYQLAELTARNANFDQTEALMLRLARNAPDRETRNRALFKLGEIYRETTNLIKAIDAFRRIKAVGSDRDSRLLNANILFEIGQTYDNLKHPLEARVAFQGVASLYLDTPLSTEAWHRAILSDADFGSFEHGEQEYERFRKTLPDNDLVSDVRLYYGQRLMDADRYAEAVKNLEAGLQEFPTSEWAELTFNTLGMALLGARRFNEAERTLRDFAERFPNSEYLPQSYYYLGEAYLEQNLYPSAIQTYEKIEDEFPGSESAQQAVRRIDEAHMMYGDYLLATGRVDAAVAQYEEIAATDLVEQAALLVADAYLQAQRYTEADDALQQFFARFPDSPLKPQATFTQGDIRMQAENYLAAEEAFSNVVAMDLPAASPYPPAAQLQIAFCRYYQDDPDGMSNALQTAITKYAATDTAGEALYWLGYLHRSLRQYAAAYDTYEELIDRYPTHEYAPEAAYLAGECLVLDDKVAQAPEVFLKVMKLYPDSGYALYALVRAGEIRLKQDELDTWLTQLETLVAENPNLASMIAAARAGVLMRAGKADEAAQAFANVDLEALPQGAQGYALALQAGIANLQGDYPGASEVASQAVDICMATGVGLDEALYQQARAAFLSEEYEQAAELYGALLSQTVIPNAQINAQALLDRARSLIEIGSTDEVVALCDQALKLRPGFAPSARAVLLKGDAMTRRNEYNQAAQYYKRATILYGRIAEYGIPAYRGLIDTYTQLGLTEQATAARQEFAQRYPDEAE
jgi:TolA-binding protein